MGGQGADGPRIEDRIVKEAQTSRLLCINPLRSRHWSIDLYCLSVLYISAFVQRAEREGIVNTGADTKTSGASYITGALKITFLHMKQSKQHDSFMQNILVATTVYHKYINT